MQKVSIIMPAYNEEKRIGRTLEVYGSYFEAERQSGLLDYEILVVINGTTDDTEGVVKKYCKTNKRVIFMNLKKGGKGYAVIQGFKDALKRKNDLIGFVDADMATPPEAFAYLIHSIDHLDGLIASRYLKGSIIVPKLSFRRLFVARVFNFIVRSFFLFPYRDTQCGAKLFKRNAVEAIIGDLAMSQWAFDVELLYFLHKKCFQIDDAPTYWKDMEGSKINVIQSSIQMLLAITQLRFYHSPFKRILRPFKKPIGLVWRMLK